MDNDDLKFLISKSGRELLESLSDSSEADLVRLLMKSDKEQRRHLTAAVNLISCRRQAAGKFSKANEMFFTLLSLEQSTGEIIADYIAQRYEPDWLVADLTCGCGGNLISLAKHCRSVIGLDIKPENIAIAALNLDSWGLGGKASLELGDVEKGFPEADAYFIDPARDRPGKSKTRSLLNSRPSINSLLPLINSDRPMGIKASPAIDYRELDIFSEKPEIEFISQDNSCKLAMLWFGALKKSQRRASCFYQDYFYQLSDDDPAARNLTPRPRLFLYDPDKAFVRAKLLPQLAAAHSLDLSGGNSPFLFSDSLPSKDLPVFRIFKVLEAEKYSVSRLKEMLKRNKVKRAELICKGVPIETDDLRRRLAIKEGGPYFVFISEFSGGQRWQILAERA